MNSGNIYKLVNSVDDAVYIGSTTQSLAQRLSKHKTASRDPRYANQRVYMHLSDIGWRNVSIVLLEEWGAEDRDDLREREQHWLDTYEQKPSFTLLNTRPAFVHCPHGRRHVQCKDCSGASICPHGRQKHHCKDCSDFWCCFCFSPSDPEGPSFSGRRSLARHQLSARHLLRVIEANSEEETSEEETPEEEDPLSCILNDTPEELEAKNFDKMPVDELAQVWPNIRRTLPKHQKWRLAKRMRRGGVKLVKPSNDPRVLKNRAAARRRYHDRRKKVAKI